MATIQNLFEEQTVPNCRDLSFQFLIMYIYIYTAIPRYSTRHSKFSNLVLSMRVMTSQPKLKSKARAALYVNEFLLSVCVRDTSNAHKAHRCSVLWSYHTLFEVQTTAGLELTLVEKARFMQAAKILCVSSRILFAEAIRAGRSTWRLLPKNHALLESFEHVRRTNFNLAYPMFPCNTLQKLSYRKRGVLFHLARRGFRRLGV